jgi:hypothetical protein
MFLDRAEFLFLGRKEMLYVAEMAIMFHQIGVNAD